ncbi:hypothetical protein C0992_000987 [Termitomyces sp. T32_za158]|nr:hypothetical protein C0992_000987 [Termitomyces sp. T32_za158]
MQNGTLVTQPENLHETLQRIKVESRNQFLRMQNSRIEVPVEQRAEFNNILDQLYEAVQEIDKQLPTYLFVLKSEEFIKRMVLIRMTVSQQRSLLASPNPRYITTVDDLRAMMHQVQQATERMHGHLRQHMGSSQQTHPLGNNIPLNNLSGQEMARPPSSLPQQPVPPPSLAHTAASSGCQGGSYQGEA